jgi:hypothetical protein
MRTDALGPDGPLLEESESTEAALDRLAELQAFELLDLGAVVRSAHPDALERAFQRARSLKLLGPWAAAMQQLHGPDYAGLATLEWMLPDETNAFNVAWFVRTMLAIEPELDVEGFDTTIGALEQVMGGSQRVQDRRLRTEL